MKKGADFDIEIQYLRHLKHRCEVIQVQQAISIISMIKMVNLHHIEENIKPRFKRNRPCSSADPVNKRFRNCDKMNSITVQERFDEDFKVLRVNFCWYLWVMVVKA